ncbi:hypothetical protein [Chitinolyticbacter meiyuanensis]|uniref:hypothetical protein n=1 Tax=Chitinolyticbacter meiyuanensis TaxID=682798 RepID=UPI0011E5EFC4|nr:hypothetical protein [Chitinolyticbacter meiyuanensis]
MEEELAKLREEVENLKKQVDFLRIITQVHYGVTPAMINALYCLAKAAKDPDVFEEAQAQFEVAYGYLLFQDATREEALLLLEKLIAPWQETP